MFSGPGGTGDRFDEDFIEGGGLQSRLSSRGRGTSFSDGVNEERSLEDETRPDRASFSAETELRHDEDPAHVQEEIRDCFPQDELAAMGLGRRDINNGHGIEIYLLDQVNPANTSGPVQLMVNVDPATRVVNINMMTLKPALLDKIDSFTRNRKFRVTSCQNLAAAEALIAKYTKENLIFDDNNQMIASLKAQLKIAHPDVKFASEIAVQPATPHHTGPGHHG